MDALTQAKNLIEMAAGLIDNGRGEQAKTVAALSQAAALVALVERLDKMSVAFGDEGSALLVAQVPKILIS